MSILHASRLLVAFARASDACVEEEVRLPADGDPLPATLFRPRRPGRAPGWVVLHGLTVFGRRHPSLLRFARALSSSGAVVLIPEIDAWTRLRVRAAPVAEAVAAGSRFLHADPGVADRPVGVIGFSFGATQALVAAATPAAAPHIGTVVGFGGYCDLPQLGVYMMTGEHRWADDRFRLDPDPYGRWIVAGNFLTAVAGLEGMGRVAAGLLELAEESGRGGLYKPDEYVEPAKVRIRDALDEEERRIWDLLAPPVGQLPADREAGVELGRHLGEAAVRSEPPLDPRGHLDGLRARAVLAHGSMDRLVPFSETLRLREAIPAHVDASATITHLFAHSKGAGGLPAARYPGEVWRLLRFVYRAMRR